MNDPKRKFDVFATKSVGDESYDTRIAVAFPLEKSPGFSVLFDALPTNGRVLPLPKRERNASLRPSRTLVSTLWTVPPQSCHPLDLQELPRLAPQLLVAGELPNELLALGASHLKGGPQEWQSRSSQLRLLK